MPKEPDFGKAMYKYAKKLGKHNYNNHRDIPESKSDSNIKNKNMVSNKKEITKY